MIQTLMMENGEHCVTCAVKENDIEIRIHWHQPGVNLIGFQVYNLGVFVAGIGEMEHES